jgi:hypothetical protein
MIKQRIRPLLLLKKPTAFFQRVGRRTFALNNRRKSIPVKPAP